MKTLTCTNPNDSMRKTRRILKYKTIEFLFLLRIMKTSLKTMETLKIKPKQITGQHNIKNWINKNNLTKFCYWYWHVILDFNVCYYSLLKLDLYFLHVYNITS